MVKVSDTPTTQECIGAFSDESAASAAVMSLRQQNVPPSAISVGKSADTQPPPSEMPTMGKVFWSGFWWSVIGAFVGVAMGLTVGLLGWGVPGTTDNIAIQVASWTMFMHVLGALLGCYLVLDTGDRFARKADHHDRPSTLVRVRSTDPNSITVSERVLRQAGAAVTSPTSPGAPPPT